jgi:hypothetical protein
MKSSLCYSKTLAFCLVSLVLLSLPGCGTEQVFEGGTRPASETATINGVHMFPLKTVDVTRVDGKSLGLMNSNAVVLPGTHVISAHLSQSYGIFSVDFDGDVILEAQGGHTYSLNGAVSLVLFNSKGFFWIEDTETGTVVSGQRPE